MLTHVVRALDTIAASHSGLNDQEVLKKVLRTIRIERSPHNIELPTIDRFERPGFQKVYSLNP
jgi:hypothetical protein